MFSGQREFRGLIITSPNLRVPDVYSMFPGNRVQQGEVPRRDVSPDFSIHHGYYLSPVAFTSPELLNDVRVFLGRQEMYKYDFYVCQWKRGRRSSLLCLVPFGKMAQDMFGILDRGARKFKRQYTRVKLKDAIDHLAGDHNDLGEMTATRVHFQVSGSDTAKSAVIAGTDVLSSELYRRLVRSLKGIQLVPRRLRMRYSAENASTALETDVYGNLWVRLRKNGTNLADLHSMLMVLDNAELIEETIAYPLRRGVVGEQADE